MQKCQYIIIIIINNNLFNKSIGLIIIIAIFDAL